MLEDIFGTGKCREPTRLLNRQCVHVFCHVHVSMAKHHTGCCCFPKKEQTLLHASSLPKNTLATFSQLHLQRDVTVMYLHVRKLGDDETATQTRLFIVDMCLYSEI